MRNLTSWLFVALITLAIGMIVISVRPPSPFNVGSPEKESTPAQSQNKYDEILNVLMPNGVWGDASQLNHFARSEEIEVLRRAQLDAKGERAIGIAFLLTALGEDYEANRRKLLDALKECGKKSYPQEGECTYGVVYYLMQLSRRGDDSLFNAILNASDKADGAFSQDLGGFWSDMLKARPDQFLAALARYPKKRQRGFCRDAGIEDGSGMDEERFRSISLLLNDISARSNSPLSTIARNCLSGVRGGYNEGIESAKSRDAM